MELPSKPTDRHAFFRNEIRRIEIDSRSDRRERFRRNRNLYLTGSDLRARARYNALKAWVALSTSLVYASENLQFGIAHPPYYGSKGPEALGFSMDDLTEMQVVAREELHRLWFDGTSTAVAQEAVTQAHYADTATVKLFVSRNEPTIDVISNPADIGVGDEHLRWDQQEVICHWYSVGLPVFWRMLQGLPERERNDLFATAVDNALPAEEARGDFMPAAVQRTIILASASPTMTGSIETSAEGMLAVPRSRTPVVQLAELWVWDDRAAQVCADCHERKRHWRHTWPAPVGHAFELGEYAPDWRVVTNHLATEQILWEPVNPLGIDGHAFFPLTLEPISGYTWGIAPMTHLINLQLWREDELDDLVTRNKLDINPPLSAYGVAMRDGEMTKAYRKPGADIPLSSPQAKVEFHRPPPLADPFLYINQIDAMQALMAGIPKAMAGQTEPGVRSGEQAIAQALLGAGPTLSRAMVVEDWLEGIATAMLRLHRNILDRPLVRNDGQRFLLRQMPGDFVARVWAHSASPIYTEHLTQKALLAHRQKLISGRDALTYLNLPGTDMLLRTQRKLEEGQAQQSERIIGIQERKARAQEAKALK